MPHPIHVYARPDLAAPETAEASKFKGEQTSLRSSNLFLPLKLLSAHLRIGPISLLLQNRPPKENYKGVQANGYRCAAH